MISSEKLQMNRERFSEKKTCLLIILVLLQSLISLSFLNSNDFFSIIVLPDTQHYSSSYPDIFYKQMDWIVENKNRLNIQYVVHLGDITNNNKENAWKVADKSFKILEDAGIPYSIVYGDNDIKSPDKNCYDGTRHTEFLNKYFPVTRFDKPGTWWKGGFFEPGKIDNYYCLFDYKDYKFLIMNLELAPRSAVLNWADNIISRNDSRKVIIVTHDYLDKTGRHLDDLKTFNLDGRDANDKLKGNNADAVFKKLVKKNSNVILVLCGHKEGEFQKEEKIKESKGSEEKRIVFEILSDFQDERLKGTDEKSGKGLLRVLKFFPEKNEITVTTVSALTGKSKDEEIHLFLEK
jgi:predicted MPP superfamily phosphohydrolase